MTRAVHPHPFQPAWRDSPLLGRCLAFVKTAGDEPGLLPVLAVIGTAALLPLIPPDLFMGGW